MNIMHYSNASEKIEIDWRSIKKMYTNDGK